MGNSCSRCQTRDSLAVHGDKHGEPAVPMEVHSRAEQPPKDSLLELVKPKGGSEPMGQASGRTCGSRESRVHAGEVSHQGL